MERDEVLRIVHETAVEFAESSGHEIADGAGSDGDNLIVRYGFSSLDALEYLLVLEEKLGITLEDEDLTESVLSSATQLATYITELQRKEATSA